MKNIKVHILVRDAIQHVLSQILAEMQQTLGDNAFSKATIRHWVAQFKLGYMRFEDFRPGLTTPEMINKMF